MGNFSQLPLLNNKKYSSYLKLGCLSTRVRCLIPSVRGLRLLPERLSVQSDVCPSVRLPTTEIVTRYLRLRHVSRPTLRGFVFSFFPNLWLVTTRGLLPPVRGLSLLSVTDFCYKIKNRFDHYI